MANIRKQFNFRNGVQVDDDNLIVTSTGLVGIGTSLPAEFLHVEGNAKIVGLASCNSIVTPSLEATSATINDITLDTSGSIIGGGVSIVGGIIQGSESGVATYFGDGGNLLNLPTSQWVDVDPGFGYTSIYAAGNVGVGTTVPAFTFQVAGNQDLSVSGFAAGVGISSDGDVLITGVTTASKFVGIGSDLTLLDANNISSGTISTSRLPVISSYILDPNQSLGIVTANILSTPDLIVSGTATVTGSLVATATTALGLTGEPDITVSSITASTSTFIDVITGTASTAQSLTTDADVDINDLTVGVATVSTRLVADTEVGIGTAAPPDKLSVYDGNIKVYRESGSVSVSIGNSVDNDGHNAQIRFGNDTALFDNSVESAFDLINRGYGNFNYYLNLNNATPAGAKTGDFNWITGTSTELMTLTNLGNLGIGNTQPQARLHVTGTSLFSGNATFEQDVSVDGNFSVENLSVTDISATGVTTSGLFVGIISAIENESNIIPDLDSDTVSVTNKLAVGSASITNPGGEGLIIINDTDSRIFISSGGVIGIGTTTQKTDPDDDNTFLEFNVVALDQTAGLGAVGVGTTSLQCLVDFSSVGVARPEISNVDDSSTMRFMLPPKLSTAERVGLSTVAGAMIYNTDLNKAQVYTGIAWEELH